jgi:hypothetical protein
MNVNSKPSELQLVEQVLWHEVMQDNLSAGTKSDVPKPQLGAQVFWQAVTLPPVQVTK